MCSFESPLLGAKPNLFLSYLNIRSYNAKLAELQIDPILQASDILCFSETWLSPHQQAQFLKILPNCVGGTVANRGISLLDGSLG